MQSLPPLLEFPGQGKIDVLDCNLLNYYSPHLLNAGLCQASPRCRVGQQNIAFYHLAHRILLAPYPHQFIKSLVKILHRVYTKVSPWCGINRITYKRIEIITCAWRPYHKSDQDFLECVFVVRAHPPKEYKYKCKYEYKWILKVHQGQTLADRTKLSQNFYV